MFPVSLYTFESDGRATQESGALILLPAELSTIAQLAYYAKAPLGWSRCPQGYYVFGQSWSVGKKLVVPGLVLVAEASPKKKFYFPPLKFDKAQIEALVSTYLLEQAAVEKSIGEARRETEAELGTLIHDLRALSGNIYHAGLEAKTDLERANYSECATRIENVLAIQTLLSLRIDSLDFASNPTLLTAADIPVFRRVDKIVRIFRATGNAKRLNIAMGGASFGLIRGPNVFELVPFAILDNAIKYSPAGQTITVSFEETARNIAVVFQSIGPKIEDDEIERIFDKKFRGVNAASSVGTGIGLSNAKTLVEHFGGEIRVRQTTEKFSINMIPYLETEFTIRFPRTM